MLVLFSVMQSAKNLSKMKRFPTKDRPTDEGQTELSCNHEKARNLYCNRKKARNLSCNCEKTRNLSCNREKARNCARTEKEKPETSFPFGLTLSLRVTSMTKVTTEQKLTTSTKKLTAEQKLTTFQSPVQYCKEGEKKQKF